MYLHDYQKHTLDKLHGPNYSGGNFILHGPRQIGLSVIIANRSLVCAAGMDGTLINIISPNQRMSDFILTLVSDTLYAGKSGRISAFDSSLDIKSRDNNLLTFTNGSRIKFMLADNRGTPWNSLDLGEIIIIENGNDIKHLYELLRCAQLSHQIIITQTGGMKKNSDLYKLHVDSVRGIHDFTYIRFPMEVAVPKQMERYEDMRVQLTPIEWVHDMEMIPYI